MVQQLQTAGVRCCNIMPESCIPVPYDQSQDLTLVYQEYPYLHDSHLHDSDLHGYLSQGRGFTIVNYIYIYLVKITIKNCIPDNLDYTSSHSRKYVPGKCTLNRKTESSPVK